MVHSGAAEESGGEFQLRGGRGHHGRGCRGSGKALADIPQQLRAWAPPVGFPLRESLGSRLLWDRDVRLIAVDVTAGSGSVCCFEFLVGKMQPAELTLRLVVACGSVAICRRAWHHAAGQRADFVRG
jgi:hypothetical protein